MISAREAAEKLNEKKKDVILDFYKNNPRIFNAIENQILLAVDNNSHSISFDKNYLKEEDRNLFEENWPIITLSYI
jgi:hypothetical protein